MPSVLYFSQLRTINYVSYSSLKLLNVIDGFFDRNLRIPASACLFPAYWQWVRPFGTSQPPLCHTFILILKSRYCGSTTVPKIQFCTEFCCFCFHLGYSSVAYS
ncbi:hypothetical protein CSKR_203081 [Clonorchis sinensis]|uniref:Uncharacterized protein n=1 Tax=Clonorchis sinensis TaxID=79923 RepID=A0A8T1M6J8_CLOSI|nr:hypothetical protein CSKR_203081 [Clonorchis sinensis]